MTKDISVLNSNFCSWILNSGPFMSISSLPLSLLRIQYVIAAGYASTLQLSVTLSPIGDPTSWLLRLTFGGTEISNQFVWLCAHFANVILLIPFWIMYLQFTFNIIRLLTEGGTLFLAMHKNAPISFLRTRCKTKNSPVYSVTATKRKVRFRLNATSTLVLSVSPLSKE